MSVLDTYPSLTDDANLKHVVTAVLQKHGIVPDASVVQDLAAAAEEFVVNDVNLTGLVAQLATAREELNKTRTELAALKPPPPPEQPPAQVAPTETVT